MSINKNQLIERVQRYLSNGLVSDDFAPSKNEIGLYINDAIAAVVTKVARGNYAVDAVYSVPEGVFTRFSFSSFTKDSNTMEWYVTLPAAPLSLPLGYSVTDVFFASKKGRSVPVYLVKAKEQSYFRNLPMKKNAAYAYVEGMKLWIFNANLLDTDQTLYVTMVSPGTSNDDATINLSEDLVQEVFNTVIAQLRQRYNLPSDSANDGQDKR